MNRNWAFLLNLTFIQLIYLLDIRQKPAAFFLTSFVSGYWQYSIKNKEQWRCQSHNSEEKSFPLSFQLKPWPSSIFIHLPLTVHKTVVCIGPVCSDRRTDVLLTIYIQWGEQVFEALPIMQVFPLTKHVEVYNFYHRYFSTVSDEI